jgi:isochorismate synthase
MEQIKRGIPEILFVEKETGLLTAFLKAASIFNCPVAFYCLPNSDRIVGVISFSSDIEFVQDIKLENRKNGFIIAPFLINETSLPFFLAGDLIIDFAKKEILYSKGDAKEDSFLKEVESQVGSSEFKLSDSNQRTPSLSTVDYRSIATKAIDKIQQGEFKKVVLARSKSVQLKNGIAPTELFISLCKEQRDSFISLVSIPGKSIWVGASPEVLISIDRTNTFRTVALAGTQEACDQDKMREAVWTQKEIEEQALVSRYIISCFKTIRLREYEEDGPKTARAGNLIHLKTDFTVNMPEVNFPDLGSLMLKLLHPTSAVCGMPKEAALDFIKNHEGLDRGFYSGFWGPVNIEKETHIFVNIRCAEIYTNQAILYSGAGITAESDPDKEMRETELKMQLLENKINQLKQS